MKKIILPILIAMLLGYGSANYLLKEYNKDYDNYELVYFLQDKEGNNIGITSKEKIANKIKEIYKEKNIFVYVKEKNISDKSFYTSLEQYDILLENSKTYEEIEAILKTIIATYEERMVNK